MNITDIAYVAGLFDGEGSITYKKYKERKKKGNKVNYYNCWRIAMEVSMTDKNAVEFIHETLGCGTLRPKKVKGRRKDGTKYLPQWKWRATFRDAYYVCLLIWPFAHVKLEKINQIIEYYADKKVINGNIIDLEEYRHAR